MRPMRNKKAHTNCNCAWCNTRRNNRIWKKQKRNDLINDRI